MWRYGIDGSRKLERLGAIVEGVPFSFVLIIMRSVSCPE